MRPSGKKKKASAPAGSSVSISDQKKAALLDDLGRSPDEQPVFSLPSPLLPWGGVVLAILITLLAPPLLRDGPVGALLAAAIALAMIVLVLIPRKLLLGQDGLLLVWMFGTRFIRFREIDSIEMTDGFYFRHPGINLTLMNGNALDFTTSIFKERWAERDALIMLIRAYCESAKTNRIPPVQQALLRAGKTHVAWARALLGMGHGAHFDPRKPGILLEDLLRIAENPDASTIERTAAFVALKASKDAAFEKRLRVSLDQTAAPAVRSALREALEADENEERLAQLLERTEKTAARD